MIWGQTAKYTTERHTIQIHKKKSKYPIYIDEDDNNIMVELLFSTTKILKRKNVYSGLW